MGELVDAMADENPARRPTIEEVVKMFESILCSLSTVKLRSPITSKNDPTIFTMFRHARQRPVHFFMLFNESLLSQCLCDVGLVLLCV